MNRRLAPVLAVVLVLALPAVALQHSPSSPESEIVSSTEPPTPTANTSARLVIANENLSATGASRTSSNLGVTLGVESDSYRTNHDTYAFEAALKAANSDREKRAIVRDAVDEIETRVAKLQANERRAVANYSQGETTTSTLLKQLGRVDAEAKRLEAALAVVRDQALQVSSPPVRTRIRVIDAELRGLQGPVRHHAWQVVTGNQDARRVTVEASDDAVVLSMMKSGTYIREAVFSQNRDPGAPKQLESDGEVLDRISELYPWVDNNSRSTNLRPSDDIYQINVSHTQGRLVVFLDSGTEGVFREYQFLDPDRMPTTELRNVSIAGYRLVLHRTYPGGPMKVSVRQNATGDPINARIAIDGKSAGTTGNNGDLWVVEPRSEYTVTLQKENTTVNVTVTGSDLVKTETPADVGSSASVTALSVDGDAPAGAVGAVAIEPSAQVARENAAATVRE